MSANTTDFWTLEEARELCAEIEKVCMQCGYHVALTGGLLYKHGPRKDLDLIFYRVRNRGSRMEGYCRGPLIVALIQIGITVFYTGEVWKRTGSYYGKPIDLLFPDED